MGEDLSALVDDETAQRITAGAKPRLLRIADLESGDVGVLTVDVRAVAAIRTFQKKDGRDGCLRRVTLGDRTGEVDLVLWGDETQQAVDGPFVAGAHLVLRGATVKPGFREGVEVHLGGAIVEEVEGVDDRVTIEGVLDTLGDTQVSGAPPNLRFKAEATLVTSAGLVNVLLWDGCIKTLRAVLPGATIRINDATIHPALEGWFVADGAQITHR